VAGHRSRRRILSEAQTRRRGVDCRCGSAPVDRYWRFRSAGLGSGEDIWAIREG
jgi:hypothetical protein